MTWMQVAGYAGSALLLVFEVYFLGRALLRPHREPSSRVAWVLVILALPAVGMVAYLLFGETNIGSRRARKYQRITQQFKAVFSADPDDERFDLPDPRYRHLFRLGHSINGFAPVAGNRAQLMPDENAAIDALVADIDAACAHVHLIFYIWLADRNGLKVAEAAKRAARRGVKVRVLVDDLGSRHFIRSEHWDALAQAGVNVARALPIKNVLLHPIVGRIDLRNHRKVMVIDNRITYCGSQNCADPEFRIKSRYAPWVDIMVRFEGPIARQNQRLFVQDWLVHQDEKIEELFEPLSPPFDHSGVLAQAIGSGPTARASAMSDVFEGLIHAAREELVVTTPYFVPTDAILSAMCAAARRGVAVRAIFPAKNDSWIVSAASRSNYAEMLAAGIRIFEYPDGLLHAKTLVVDGALALIGSANLDRRSFDLNYENNILFQDPDLARELRGRQERYIAASRAITVEEVEAWGIGWRLWNNAVAMLGPVF